MEVVILAGGLATRLRPITESIPKSLVEVAGAPFISHQLNYLYRQGLKRVMICTGFLGNMIEDFVGNGAKFGLQVRYSSDGPNQLGTGGALRKIIPLLEDNFFLTYGDSFLPISFSEVQMAFERSGKPALMTVLRNTDKWDTSNTVYSEGQVICYDKRVKSSEMKHIDYGLSIISRSVLDPYPTSGPFDLGDVFTDLARAGLLAGQEVFERFYEIGSHKGLSETEDFFLRSAMD